LVIGYRKTPVRFVAWPGLSGGFGGHNEPARTITTGRKALPRHSDSAEITNDKFSMTNFQ
jgi:hypothetical protein